MEIYLKISKLLLAHKTQNISAQETEELLAWRQEKTENEELPPAIRRVRFYSKIPFVRAKNQTRKT